MQVLVTGLVTRFHKRFIAGKGYELVIVDDLSNSNESTWKYISDYK